MGDDQAGWNQQVHAIGTAHFRIHQGRLFTVGLTDEAVLAAAVFDALIVTGTIPPHMVISAASEVNARLQLFEDTTTSADGSANIPMNNNRMSTRASDLRLYSGPTITGVGTQLDGDRLILAGKANTGGSEITSFLETILKPNSKYLIRMTNISVQTGVMSIAAYYYEPTWPI